MFYYWLVKFLAFLEKKGRKYALVGFAGDIVGYKNFLFHKELAGKEKRWPNAFIHEYIRVGGIDGKDVIHSHPYNCISIVLHGQLTEYCKETEKTLVRNPGSIRFIKSTDRHSIVEVQPHTLTLFIRGFKKKDWEIGLVPCNVVCERCQGAYGHCEKENGTLPLSELLDYPEEGGKWRGVRWMPFNDQLMGIINKHKAALVRAKIEPKEVNAITEFKKK